MINIIELKFNTSITVTHVQHSGTALAYLYYITVGLLIFSKTLDYFIILLFNYYYNYVVYIYILYCIIVISVISYNLLTQQSTPSFISLSL